MRKKKTDAGKIIWMVSLLTLLALSTGCENTGPDSAVTVTESTADTEGTFEGVDSLDPQASPTASSGIDFIFQDKNDAQLMDELYHDYKTTGGEVAVVTDRSNILDSGYNQAVFNGAATYAQAAGVSYSFYSAGTDSEAEYEKVITDAIDAGASLVICASSHFAQAIGSLQDTWPDIHFLLLDAVPINASGDTVPISKNVHCIQYQEEEAGYLAGYLCVMDGYSQFGFIGGETLPSVIRYGYGYLQGIDAAAKKLGVSDTIHVNYWYSGTFYPQDNIADKAESWYRTGTEVIFACGGSIYESILPSANVFDGYLIGVDVDQSQLSHRFLTSAMKGIENSVIISLDDYFAYGNTWSKEYAGQMISYGADKKCIELPVTDDAWRFERVSFEDYETLLSNLKTGEVHVDNSITLPPDVSISVTYCNTQENSIHD